MTGFENPHVAPKITFYTFPDCPWCQRVHILLSELQIPFEEVYIDLSQPREQWYLDINPRGLVPAIKFSNGVVNDEILYESSIVSQFIADSRPSHVLPASLADPSAPLRRARIQFFIDTFMSKLGGQWRSIFAAEDPDAKAQEIVKGVEKEVEGLLKDAAPFVDGSKELTFAETQTAPFLLRIYALSAHGELPKSLKEGLEALPNFGKWAKALIEHPSVKANWNEERVVSGIVAKLQAMRQAKA
ncbi:glutathione-S-transferase-like protein omega 1 [Phyllosticta capitalensis]